MDGERLAANRPEAKTEIGVVGRHYLRCPHCHGYANLETHRCSTCGAEALYIVWGTPTRPLSPELVLVERRR